ncbi:DUF4184 family protein [Hymenobacter glacialis]|uniref:DUF4184 domain-containing protein n=1 Tax=Hymenobacter glacialis TaxID=1908236 RepID=A0A1G1SYS3_9BACT|nr:DUF4184 family protein [Hymenobacter glacialis]OGX83766.1 hypothetical protein BEN48_03070 [Hymenobacter glacialis]
MPFTLFHPALILPLRRLPKRWVSLTGLVAGSMAPDFEKFGKMKALNYYSHTWLSLLYFTLPVGLVLSFVFHAVVRNPLMQHLPEPVRRRLRGYRRFDWRRHFVKHYPAVVASVLLGGASHLLWDGLTHRQGPFARQLPFLDTHWSLGPVRLPGFMVLSVVTSLVALGYMAHMLWQLPKARRLPTPAPGFRLYWPAAALLTAGIIAVRVVAFGTTGNSWDIAVTVLSAFLLSLVLTPLLGKLGRRKARSAGNP